jgi:hypothetical protein
VEFGGHEKGSQVFLSIWKKSVLGHCFVYGWLIFSKNNVAYT